jgi:hypothetical protein
MLQGASESKPTPSAATRWPPRGYTVSTQTGTLVEKSPATVYVTKRGKYWTWHSTPGCRDCTELTARSTPACAICTGPAAAPPRTGDARAGGSASETTWPEGPRSSGSARRRAAALPTAVLAAHAHCVDGAAMLAAILAAQPMGTESRSNALVVQGHHLVQATSEDGNLLFIGGLLLLLLVATLWGMCMGACVLTKVYGVGHTPRAVPQVENDQETSGDLQKPNKQAPNTTGGGMEAACTSHTSEYEADTLSRVYHVTAAGSKFHRTPRCHGKATHPVTACLFCYGPNVNRQAASKRATKDE